LSGKLCQILAVLNLLRNSCAVQPRVGCAKLSAYALMLLFFGGMLGVAHAQEEGAGAEVAEAVQEASTSPLSDEIESLKKKALELNRDLLILEEELLFPANTQVMVFLRWMSAPIFGLMQLSYISTISSSLAIYIPRAKTMP